MSEDVEVSYYKFNLCDTEKDFVCQFDLHMRNHTKYGQSIMILGIQCACGNHEGSFGYVKEVLYRQIESELMKTMGVCAVLSVFGKDWLVSKGLIERSNSTVNLGAALLLKPGINIRKELLKTRKVRIKYSINK